jgi:hypothetical protein
MMFNSTLVQDAMLNKNSDRRISYVQLTKFKRDSSAAGSKKLDEDGQRMEENERLYGVLWCINLEEHRQDDQQLFQHSSSIHTRLIYIQISSKRNLL